MKQLILSVAIIAATLSSAFAFEKATKAENDAAMAANRKVVAAKVAILETNVKAHNTQAVKTISQELLKLMYKGMNQSMVEINYERGDQQVASNKHYNEMEKTVYSFKLLSADPKANADQLLAQAKTFVTQY